MRDNGREQGALLSKAKKETSGITELFLFLEIMNDSLKALLLEKTGAAAITNHEQIQELWSGYGQIIRVVLQNAFVKSVIVKHVRMPGDKSHPRGWNSDIGHRRKIKSYQVESNWYEQYSKQSTARLPYCLAIECWNDEVIILLEDLDEAGYSIRKETIDWHDLTSCLKWLAQFHARYVDKTPVGLWAIGTYWHLDTRPQELAALTDPVLKKAAPIIDNKLNNCRYKTFVHGDAKLANFCFSPKGQVAAVDFQYTGGGCGMKDLAYFIGSCLNEQDCERLEARILDTYFNYLQAALPTENQALEQEWRSLYRVAWADFHRFIKGWSPGHWKINSYSERITREVINAL